MNESAIRPGVAATGTANRKNKPKIMRQSDLAQ
jgi:hypothetical protein